MWLGEAGFIVTAIGLMYQHFVGNIQLEFVQSLSRGYEFQIKNDTPSDRLIKRFRIYAPLPQQVLYKTTRDVYAERNAKGEIVLPRGNTGYVPATEFKELDGQKIPANSSIRFRIPPLSSSSWMEPEASIIDIHYEVEATHPILLPFERLLNVTGIRSEERTVRYLVLDNYWMVSQSSSLNEAIRIACRDDDSIAKTPVCNTVQ